LVFFRRRARIIKEENQEMTWFQIIWSILQVTILCKCKGGLYANDDNDLDIQPTSFKRFLKMLRRGTAATEEIEESNIIEEQNKYWEEPIENQEGGQDMDETAVLFEKKMEQQEEDALDTIQEGITTVGGESIFTSYRYTWSITARSIFSPLQGFLNALVFFIRRARIIKEENLEMTWFQIIWSILPLIQFKKGLPLSEENQ